MAPDDAMIESKPQAIATSVTPSRTFGERLSEERTRWFVGRQADLELLDSLLDTPSCSLLYVTGQAGVGKTSLLHEFVGRCLKRARPLGYLDAAEFDGHSQQELQHWYTQHATRLADSARESPSAGRPVLVIDSYERVAT